MSDRTLNKLAQRFNRPTPKGATTGETVKKKTKHRSRQSLHFADQSMQELDEAYRKAEHDSYPQKLNKANFVEAMIVYGIQHIDEVVALALEQQEKEEE